MSTISLTPDVCARFGVATDYLVLVSRPTLRVTEIEELVECEIGGFIARWRVTLEDGTNAVSQVVFPDGSDIHSSIVVGTVIKIDQMVRVPNGGESVIVAYTVTPDVVLKLTDMDQEIRLLSALLEEQTQLRLDAQAKLQALLPANLPAGLTPQTLVNQFFDVLIQVIQATDQAMI